ncbi:hypothetical protein OG372_19885 [Streptomyces sp. NBC_01020]|uniref:hypothetical protein n=1 Tax=Streptomyces sp. NBC_01020 TaxID=2903722 RepID=UPI0038689032|nr:hypothetical protein OG372_19885 [Streptomyces sp. NBC_01020]
MPDDAAYADKEAVLLREGSLFGVYGVYGMRQAALREFCGSSSGSSTGVLRQLYGAADTGGDREEIRGAGLQSLGEVVSELIRAGHTVTALARSDASAARQLLGWTATYRSLLEDLEEGRLLRRAHRHIRGPLGLRSRGRFGRFGRFGQAGRRQ